MTLAVSERRRLLTVCLWLWIANAALGWVLHIGFVGYRVPGSPGASAFLLLAYLAHFAGLQGLLVGLVALVLLAFPRRAVLVGLAPPFLAIGHWVLYLDRIVYDLYRFHVNGSVVAMLTTPGVGDNLELSAVQIARPFLVLAALAAAEYGACRWLYRLAAARPALVARVPGHAAVALGLLLAMTAAEKVTHAVADARDRRDVLVNARVLPFYQPLTAKRFLRSIGVEVPQVQRFDRSQALQYPLEPLAVPPHPNRWNILWVAIEGWRFDMLNPRVTPRLNAFAERAVVGTRHYSSGNATRHGIFGLFYGLNGFYWQPVLAEQRGPVLLQVLRNLGYQMRIVCWSSLENPNFRSTCFVDVPEWDLLDHYAGDTPARDVAVAEAFRSFLSARNPARPFFSFLFFGAPHSYRFAPLPGFAPPCDEPDRPHVDREKLAADPEEARAAFRRYQNSLAYVDVVLGGVLAEMEARGLLRSTLIMISGDHGDAFGESGLFGHNSSFDDWQIRTPLIVHCPGVAPGRIEGLTSHLDWAPTVLAALGVRTPPARYAQGLNILAPFSRDFVVAASWNDGAIITDDGMRLVFPLEAYRRSTLDIYDANRRPVPDPEAALRRHGEKLQEVLRSSRTFRP